MLTSSDIRQQFIDYFTSKHEHTFAPSSSVIPHDDNTLLFRVMDTGPGIEVSRQAGIFDPFVHTLEPVDV